MANRYSEFSLSFSHFVNPKVQLGSEYKYQDILSLEGFELASKEITSWNNYKPTPLHSFDDIAQETGVSSVFYKDENTNKMSFDQKHILKYLEETTAKNSSWEGECFVFDDRVAVDENLEPGSYEQCFACRRPVSEYDRQSPAQSLPESVLPHSATDRDQSHQTPQPLWDGSPQDSCRAGR